MISMIYADANVFIYPLLNDKTDPLSRASVHILTKIIKGEIQAATSFLTWDEVVWQIRKNTNPDAAVSEGAKFLKFPKLIFINVDSTIITLAQDLVERYGIKPRDSIHAATAISRGIREIITEDEKFDRITELKRKSVSEFQN